MIASNVYVLIFPHLNAVKVGKADNLFNRIQQLNHWGKPNLDLSFVIKVDRVNVLKFEWAFHLALIPFKKDMPKKDGYTEFFDIKALPEIQKIMNLFRLEKSIILLDEEKKNISSRKHNKESIFRNRVENRIELLNRNLQLMNNLKMALILVKRKNVYCEYTSKGELIVRSKYLNLIKKKLLWISGVRVGGAIISVSRDETVIVNIVSVVQFFNKNILSDLFVHIDILLFCYNFLKKDLPNESELPKITLNKNNELVISN